MGSCRREGKLTTEDFNDARRKTHLQFRERCASRQFLPSCRSRPSGFRLLVPISGSAGIGEILRGAAAICGRPGKTQLYNETITCAYFFLIRERMARCDSGEWEEFARRNPDLLTWKEGILESYYRAGTPKSELARRVFVLPDKCSQ
jgi:hypothetical protein